MKSFCYVHVCISHFYRKGMLPCANDFRKADKFKEGIKIVLTYIFDPFILMLSIIKGLRCLKPFSCISI